MDLLSHLLWTHVLFRNRLWRDEALVFALLPDAGFFLMLAYTIFCTPMNVGFDEAMLTMPAAFMVFYRLMHSFVVLGIVALLVWRFRRAWLPVLWAWALHICMDIPFHTGAFSTRFLYPLLPDLHIEGIPWSDYRVLAFSYMLMAIAYLYMENREMRKHRRRRRWSPDLFDRTEAAIAALINPKPVPVGHAVGNLAGASGRVPGEDRQGPGEGESGGAGALPPP